MNTPDTALSPRGGFGMYAVTRIRTRTRMHTLTLTRTPTILTPTSEAYTVPQTGVGNNLRSTNLCYVSGVFLLHNFRQTVSTIKNKKSVTHAKRN